ncbi:unnamed protein product [Rangifer tarandus platyrhynchus]|uniref:Uncharacterized protein n=1 Tax=Rangifer tarandus platyrhynchus TaxID=3082113 RepID=A0ABN8Z2C4_RANTA|nr:unnamed protein product [Rangifer tarandus platyrhynchus]
MIGFGRLFYFLIGARIALPASPHPPDPVSRKRQEQIEFLGPYLQVSWTKPNRLPPCLIPPARASGEKRAPSRAPPPALQASQPRVRPLSLPSLRRSSAGPSGGDAEVAAFQTPGGPLKSRGVMGVGRQDAPDPGLRPAGLAVRRILQPAPQTSWE